MDQSADLAAIPYSGRICAVDYGTVRIGWAITDPAQSLVSPGEIYHRRTPALDAGYFQQLSQQEQICGFIVGLPVHGNGQESQKSREARQFAKWLGGLTSQPVALHDERYTTRAAEEILRESGLKASQRKKHLDKLAATVLLQSYLESRHQPTHSPPPLEDPS
ncbi:MAG: Holliday junction resolvase RuvX [Pirellulales bacterium]|nr:Holliday junction resolvase RuvX [Pirellulales bacterium]